MPLFVAIAIAAPAQARNVQGYFGVYGDLLFPRKNVADEFVDFKMIKELKSRGPGRLISPDFYLAI